MMKSVPWVDVFSSACVDSMRVHHLVVFLVRGAPQQATVISSPQAAVGMFAWSDLDTLYSCSASWTTAGRWQWENACSPLSNDRHYCMWWFPMRSPILF